MAIFNKKKTDYQIDLCEHTKINALRGMLKYIEMETESIKLKLNLRKNKYNNVTQLMST